MYMVKTPPEVDEMNKAQCLKELKRLEKDGVEFKESWNSKTSLDDLRDLVQWGRDMRATDEDEDEDDESDEGKDNPEADEDEDSDDEDEDDEEDEDDSDDEEDSGEESDEEDDEDDADEDDEPAAAKKKKKAYKFSGGIIVNQVKFKRAQNIIGLINGTIAPQKTEEEDRLTHYSRILAARSVDPASKDAVYYLYEIVLRGLVRSQADEKEHQKKVKELRKKMKKKAVEAE